jgi:hypothetical protein
MRLVLEELKVSVGWTDDDSIFLQLAGRVLEDHTKEIVDHWRNGIIASIPNLARHSQTPEGDRIPEYVANSGERFEQWIGQLPVKSDCEFCKIASRAGMEGLMLHWVVREPAAVRMIRMPLMDGEVPLVVDTPRACKKLCTAVSFGSPSSLTRSNLSAAAVPG